MRIITKQTADLNKKGLIKVGFWSIIIFTLLFLLLYKLDDWPSAWWDEGWYLDAARNWIEQGHLGHFLDGQPIPPRIPVRFPVLLPIAASMKIFGVGIWQGRLPGAILSLLAVGLFVYLANLLYNRKVAIFASLIILFISPLDFNPIYLGRQIWAEMSMMFYLFAGYTFLWLAIKRKPVWGLGAALFFGIANHAKLQVPPFWLVSMLLAIWVATKYKQKTTRKIIIGVVLGSIAIAAIFFAIQNRIMPGSFGDPALTRLLLNTVILVLTGPVRIRALTYGILFALPQIIGLIFVGHLILRLIFTHQISTQPTAANEERVNKDILRASLWGIAASWCIWYLTMGLFWVRYLFPAYFIGCIFFAAYLEKLTDGYNFRILIRRASSFLLLRGFNQTNFQSVVVVIAISLTLGVAIKTTSSKIITPQPDPKLAANYLEKNIPSGAKVETFGSELFILAKNIDFHYPSDLVSMQFYRKLIVDPQLNIDYAPLDTKPDYLVVDPFSAFWKLYDIVIPADRVEFEAEVGGYRIYRVINAP